MSMALQNDHVKDTSASADRFPGVHREEQDLREELLLTEKYFNKIVEVLKILLPASSTDASKRSPLYVQCCRGSTMMCSGVGIFFFKESVSPFFIFFSLP